MPIVTLFLVLIILGVAVWAITTFIPMDPNFAMLIRVVGIIVALVYVLNAFGVIGGAHSLRVPSLK